MIWLHFLLFNVTSLVDFDLASGADAFIVAHCT